ncbi:hypothetical protein GF324_14575 [bacterium]|nr:hypothetical protein [bacterium]
MKRVLLVMMMLALAWALLGMEEGGKEGSIPYDKFEKPKRCGTSCHENIYRQWEQAMMSQCYTHKWDEIEYFDLAVAHANADPAFEGVKAACDGCHAPLSYLAGDNPPPRPSEGSRANESVSCDVCHTITGFEGDTPFNFNWTIEPGRVKYGPREGAESPHHTTKKSDFLSTTEFCGTCHNEKSDFGAWVKATQIEWKEGPYAEEGVHCQECHMTQGPMTTAKGEPVREDAWMHLFHGAHDPGKVRGTIEVRIHPDLRMTEPGGLLKFTCALFNQKTGHKFPTGSVEDRIVWLHVEATDADGNSYHLPVDKKGFDGEEYTIAADVLAYQDMEVPLGLDDFEGIQRDGVPYGDRIFRMPYFDPQGRMTIMQWNTKSFGPDYRIGPKETKTEHFTFEIPFEAAPGEMTVTATLNYKKLVEPVGKFLDVPAEEYETIVVNSHSTTVEILP